jgi:hypothetical protein
MGTETLSDNKIREPWKKGITQVTQYDPGLGATYYITKEFARDEEWDAYDICLPPTLGTPDA